MLVNKNIFRSALILFFGLIALNSTLFGQAQVQLPEKLAGALRFPTIAHIDTLETDWDSFFAFQKYLAHQFPRLHSTLELETIGGHSLLFKWKGKYAETLPIMFNHHQDVVPADTSMAGAWTYPPFEGKIADGYIWGRGALDTKGPMLAIMEAIEQLIESGFQPPCDIYLALGQDEEVGGMNGARKIAKTLEARNIKMALIFDEGPSVVEAIFEENNPPVALVGLAEKGAVNIQLTAKGLGGHSSIPPFETAIGKMAAAISKVEQNPMPARLLPITLESFRSVAPLLDGKTQFALKNANLLRGQILKALAKEPITDALIRTKISPTVIEGGYKENVLPREVRANLNVRLLQGDSISSVLAYLKEIINDPDIEFQVVPGFVEASPITSSQTAQFAHFKASMLEVYPDAIVSPTLMPAGTDSKNYTRLSENIFRCSPFKIGKEEAERIHNNDERIAISSLENLVHFYRNFIESLPSEWKEN